jgi:hypothetical protein
MVALPNDPNLRQIGSFIFCSAAFFGEHFGALYFVLFIAVLGDGLCRIH